jgi:L-serine deaminase
MENSIQKGCFPKTKDVGGPLKLQRRAPGLYQKLKQNQFTAGGSFLGDGQPVQQIGRSPKFTDDAQVKGPSAVAERRDANLNLFKPNMGMTQNKRRLLALDWLSVFAIAVNEENAAGGECSYLKCAGFL